MRMMSHCDGRQVFEDIKLSTKCFSCPYYNSDDKDVMTKKDGYDECWRHATKNSIREIEMIAFDEKRDVGFMMLCIKNILEGRS